MSDIKFPITRPFLPEKDAFMRYAGQIWDNRWLTNGGPLAGQLETALRDRLKVDNIVVFANGHLALDGALKALGLQDGEAITTPLTFISTTNALAMNNLTPVFCDVKPTDCTIDETKIEALITEKTKVIVPVHVYGFPCNCKAIEEIARRHNLKVVYDAAHVFGVEVDGQGIGCFGDASMFSFHATKVFHTVEGGGVTFSDPALRPPLLRSKNFGVDTTTGDAASVSFNAKMTEFHAAMGLANLEIVDQQLAKRKILVERYLERLKDVPQLELFRWDNPAVTYNYAYFPVLVSRSSPADRDTLFSCLLNEHHIQARKYFYPLISDFSCYNTEHNSGDTPIAKDISSRVLTLPLYYELNVEDVDHICEVIREIVS